MRSIIIALSALLTLSVGVSFSQIAVTNTQTPTDLVQNVLLGFGVTANNITVNGIAANANLVQGNATYFDAAGTTFPIPSGVLLTTGNGIAAIGPNNSGSLSNNNPATPNVGTDPHLNAIAAGTVTNGIVLEFDFVPSGDTISFNYIFGSEEYPEFSPSSFNDAFGFFLWGPGITGPYALAGYPAGGVNLAQIPGTTLPVTINNLGPGAGQYPQYYLDNQNGIAYGPAIQYDGTTTVLSANASVQCNQTYHIKLCIGNVLDTGWDSGVFLQANSFSSEAIQVAVATVSGDTTVVEGCSVADLMFIRPQTQTADSLTINYTITGTATPGVDFQNLPSPVVFVPGQDTLVLTIDPIADGFSDNMEYVTITVETITSCGDTIVSSGTLWFVDSVNIPIDEPDPIVPCVDDSVMVTVSATGGTPPYTFNWSTGEVGPTAYLATVTGAMTGSIDYYVTVTDACNYTNTDTVTVTLNQTLQIDTMISYPSSACDPTGAVSGFASGITGTPYYNWTGPGPNSPNFIDATVWQNLSPGWYYFTVTDNVCSVNDSIMIDTEPGAVASGAASPNYGCAPLNVTFTNNSQNATSYEWDFGGGNIVNTNNTNPINQTLLNSVVVRLIAFDSQGCPDTTYIPVTVDPCGCTDPLATNYNPIASIDDGSCVYPTPVVVAPNVFTPNGDNENDLFELDHQFAVEIELVIVNRWGNIMYESTGPNPVWDGTAGSNDAAEGTYFYKYRAVGAGGDEITGHGFVQLIRD